MKLISPTNREVDIGQTLLPNEYIGMTRREVLDVFLRDRAVSLGTSVVNGLVTDIVTEKDGSFLINYANPDSSKDKLAVDYIIGADGANSRVAKAIDAGEYNYAIAFQERIKVKSNLLNTHEFFDYNR
jgi:geranylgeranyl reductase